MNPPVFVPVCVSGFVTTTSAAPSEPDGVVAVIDVAETNATFVAAAPPNVTVAPLTKFVPVMVTTVRPVVGPPIGDTAVTVGADA